MLIQRPIIFQCLNTRMILPAMVSQYDVKVLCRIYQQVDDIIKQIVARMKTSPLQVKECRMKVFARRLKREGMYARHGTSVSRSRPMNCPVQSPLMTSQRYCGPSLTRFPTGSMPNCIFQHHVKICRPRYIQLNIVSD